MNVDNIFCADFLCRPEDTQRTKHLNGTGQEVVSLEPSNLRVGYVHVQHIDVAQNRTLISGQHARRSTAERKLRVRIATRRTYALIQVLCCIGQLHLQC